MTRHPAARRSLRVAGWAAAGSAVALLTACGEATTAATEQVPAPPGVDQDSLNPKGPDARMILDLFTPFFWIAVVIGVLVLGATVYAAVRFRARSDDERPKQVHGNTGLEVAWTIVPAVILAVMAVPTVAVIFDLAEEPDGDDVVEILVTGKQWWWEFEYPEEGIVTANEMHIPVDRPVALWMTSDDVIHSFWVPNLAGKRDVVPGREHFLRIEADEPGLFLGQCAEYCGLSHANMRLRVYAHEDDAWQEWVADQQRELTPEQADYVLDPDGPIQQFACVQCHAFRGAEGATARVGPDLTHLATRDTFAGAIFELDAEHLRQWLRDAPGMKPMQTGSQPGDAPNVPAQVPGMPPFPSMTDEQADELVEFLLSLE